MAPKSDKSKSLVTVGAKRAPTGGKSARPGVATELTGTSLLPILGSPHAVAKLAGTGGFVMREEGMLQATREPEWEDLPMAEVVEAVVAAGRGAADDARESALREFERQVGRRRHLFTRERVGRSHLVTLTGVGARARMPTLRVMWSMSFTDKRARDDMFGWLAQRVDRWDDWGHMAYGHGADALTSHLLALVVAGGGLS